MLIYAAKWQLNKVLYFWRNFDIFRWPLFSGHSVYDVIAVHWWWCMSEQLWEYLVDFVLTSCQSWLDLCKLLLWIYVKMWKLLTIRLYYISGLCHVLFAGIFFVVQSWSSLTQICLFWYQLLLCSRTFGMAE